MNTVISLHPGLDCIDTSNKFLLHTPHQDVGTCVPGCIRKTKSTPLPKKKNLIPSGYKTSSKPDVVSAIPRDYEELWTIYFSALGKVRKYMTVLLKNEPDDVLDDMLSVVYIECMSKDIIRTFYQGDFLLYILGICRNQVLNYYNRRDTIKHAVSIDCVDGERASGFIQDALKHTHTPERVYESRELLHVLAETVESMAEIGRTSQQKTRWSLYPRVFEALMNACDAGADRDESQQVRQARHKNSVLSTVVRRPGYTKEVKDALDLDDNQTWRYIGEIREVARKLCAYPKPPSLF